MNTNIVSVLLLFLVSITACSKKPSDGLNLPAMLAQFYDRELAPTYRVNRAITPVYLEGDFNGDNEKDFALAVVNRVNKNKGVVIFHSTKGSSSILSSSVKFSALNSMTEWKIVNGKTGDPWLKPSAILVFHDQRKCSQIYHSGDEKMQYTLSSFKEGVFQFRYKNKMGLMNIDGDTIIPNEYKFLEFHNLGVRDTDGYVIEAHSLGNKVGILSPRNEVLIPVKYDFLRLWYYYGHHIVNVWIFTYYPSGKTGIYSLDGKELIPVEYDQLYKESDSLFYTEKDGKRGWRTLTRELVPPKYDYGIVPFYLPGTNPAFIVQLNGKIDIRDKYDSSILAKGQTVYNYTIDGYSPVREGTAVIKSESGVGMLNVDRRFILPPVFDSILKTYHSTQNYWVVAKNGKYGVFYSRGENMVVPLIYDARSFHFADGDEDNFSFALRDPKTGKLKYGVVDKYHNVVVSFEYDEITSYNGKFIVVRKEKNMELLIARVIRLCH